MRKLTIFCMMAALVAFVAAPAYAEVQNVKVGGDITLRSIYQNQYDLHSDDDNTTVGLFGTGVQGSGDENATSFMATVGLDVDADLTDNVSASIRLISERDWSTSYEDIGFTHELGVDARMGYVLFDDIGVDLAYITLKEMLYSPLTVIIGRQDLWYGDGFIVGANRRPRAIMAPEFTDFTSFDAIRGILDYDPWTIDLLYARVDEGTWVKGARGGALYPNNLVDDDENIELWGINVGYVFDQYNAEAEAYYFGQTLPRQVAAFGIPGTLGGRIVGCPSSKDNVAHIVGVRGSFEPVENLDIRGEFAGEFGRAQVTAAEVEDIGAFACDVNGSYTWADFSWMPTLGLGYVYMSGEPTPRNDDWNGWVNLYRGKYYSAIHEWQDVYYNPDDVTTNGGRQAGTNQHIVIVDGSVQPTDDILLEARYLHFQAVEQYGILATMADRSLDVGDELDLRLTYDYTEDVTFGLLSAWFFPGEYYLGAGAAMDHPAAAEVESNDIASEIVASVTLVF
jgi:hypothetical protein